MRKIDQLLTAYGVSHTHPFNKLIHWVCVPAIFFSIVGLIYCIPPGPVQSLDFLLGSFANWASFVLLILLGYYWTISPPLTLGMFLFSAMSLALANFLSIVSPIPLWLICLIIFVIAWIFQFYGHKIEGKKPSFFQDLQFLLIGPAWLMHFIYKKIGLAY
jgi:uncharacterized membrane protein YGL010W